MATTSKRTRVTKEIIMVTENIHAKHPEMTNEAIAAKVGCSGTTVGRILAGCYDIIDGKVHKKSSVAPVDRAKAKVVNINKNAPTSSNDISLDLGKIVQMMSNQQKQTTSEYALKSLDAPLNKEQVKKPEFSLDLGDPMTTGIFKMIMNIFGGLFKDDKKEEAKPDDTVSIDEQRFRKKVMTEIQTLRETEVDIYKEIKQLKGILSEIRDLWKA